MSRVVAILLAVLSLGFGTGALAQEGAERRFTWRPSIQMRSVLNDNVTLTEGDEDADFGVWMAPRFEAAYRASEYQLGFDGSVDVRRYTDSVSVDEVF